MIPLSSSSGCGRRCRVVHVHRIAARRSEHVENTQSAYFLLAKQRAFSLSSAHRHNCDDNVGDYTMATGSEERGSNVDPSTWDFPDSILRQHIPQIRCRSRRDRRKSRQSRKRWA